jgi:Flp pilus assembly protein TadG
MWRRLARGKREDGQALVEFALVLPVLLLILLAILKLGLLFNNYLTLTDSVRSGARFMALERGAAGNYCSATDAQVKNSASGLNPANITFTPSGSGVTFTGTDSCTSLTQGNSITLQANYPCDFKLMGITFVPSCSLTVSASERVE